MPRAVFRVSPLTVLFAVALGVCAIPVAFGAPYLWLIYLVPLGIVAWTLRTRTVVDAEGMPAITAASSRDCAEPAVCSEFRTSLSTAMPI